MPVLTTFALRRLAPSDANASDESFDAQGSRWNTFINFRTVKSAWSRGTGTRGVSTTRRGGVTMLGLAARGTTATGVSSVTADEEAGKSKVDAEGGLGIGLGSVSEPEWRDTKVTWVEPARP